MLDLACGTGQVAFALAGHVSEVWAVDQEQEFTELLADLAGALEAERIALGAATTRGLGRVKLTGASLTRRELGRAEHLLAMLAGEWQRSNALLKTWRSALFAPPRN